MNKVFVYEYITKPSDVKYKRRIWAGVRDKAPKLGTLLHPNSPKTINEELNNVGLFPSLIVWDNISGERKYAEARAV